MQFKRTALLALSAFSLAACGSDDDGPTGGSGLNDQQRIQEFQELVQAGADAAAAGAPGAAAAFNIAGYGFLFGASTTTLSATSNGLSLSVAGRQPNFATAGSYQVLALRFIDNETYGPGETETYESNLIVAYRDESDLIWADLYDTRSGTFNSESDVSGGVFTGPNREWYASAGNASMGTANQGGECSLSNTIRNVIEDELGDDETLTSWTCRYATFPVAINITESGPNQHATGSRTANMSGNVSGVVITANWDYSNTTRQR